jgi:integrase
MPRRAITKRLVDRMQPGDPPIFDTEVRGFGVRRQTAAKVYFVKRRIRGKQRWLTIGEHGSPWTVENARARALALLGEIADGGDPATDRDHDIAAGTFNEFADKYLEVYAETKKKPRSAASDRTNLRLNIRPTLGPRRLTDITRADIAKLHHELRDKPGAANRCLALLSKMFNLAETWGLRSPHSNPVRHIDRYPERKMQRFLSFAELARVGDVLKCAETERIVPSHSKAKNPKPREGGENPFLIAAVRLLLFTGARRSEILTAKWEYLDFERVLLALPDSKTGAKEIPLGAPAIAVLKDLEKLKVEGNPYILPGHVGGKHLANIDKFWRAVCKAASIPKCRIHDLRHSFGGVGAGGGDSLLLIGKLLGHSDPRTTMRYAHLAPDPVRGAADRISAAIAAALDGKPLAKVMRLRGGRD